MKYHLNSVSPAARDYAAELNEQQLAAVTTRSRHALVIAGAGSGKTRTLTYRVAWLVEQGVAPWRILLLTFTNKAAKEMLGRVSQLAGLETQSIWGGTFHSVSNRILRRHAEQIGYTPSFTILDGDDQVALMKSIHKQYAPKESRETKMAKKRKGSLFPTAKLLLSLHSLAASMGRQWHEVMLERFPDWEPFEDSILAIFKDYAQRKKESNAMDFDDLLSNTAALLEGNEELRELYRNRFEHILVDEYQDTNAPQERLISLLGGGENSSLMVVGDDAQSIYSWRGAQVEHIFRFQERHPDAQLFKIETNYRSVPSILALSNAAISLNSCQFEKNLRSHRQEGKVLPALVPVADKRVEARFIAQRIDELTDDGLILGKDIAILYRAHYHSMELQMELLRRRIPFRITSGVRFFEQAHVKDVLCFLRLLVNPGDEIALKRLLMMFPRVGEVSAQKIAAAWRMRWLELQKQENLPHLRGRFVETMSGITGITPSLKNRWKESLELLDRLDKPQAQEGQDEAPKQPELSPDQLVVEIVHHLKPYLMASYENAEDRMDDLEHLSQAISKEGTLDEFLAEVCLMSELDKQSEQSDEMDEHKVCLSTIHQAKGLEWKVIFILSLAEGHFPTRRAMESLDPTDMEEETRLFYVAVTRAEDQLYLMYPRYSGGYDGQYLQPSPFLSPLNEDLVELWEL